MCYASLIPRFPNACRGVKRGLAAAGTPSRDRLFHTPYAYESSGLAADLLIVGRESKALLGGRA